MLRNACIRLCVSFFQENIAGFLSKQKLDEIQRGEVLRCYETAAFSTAETSFTEAMMRISDLSEPALSYILTYSPSEWATSKIPLPTYGVNTSNWSGMCSHCFWCACFYWFN
jgi:hypothetical protein